MRRCAVSDWFDSGSSGSGSSNAYWVRSKPPSQYWRCASATRGWSSERITATLSSASDNVLPTTADNAGRILTRLRIASVGLRLSADVAVQFDAARGCPTLPRRSRPRRVRRVPVLVRTHPPGRSPAGPAGDAQSGDRAVPAGDHFVVESPRARAYRSSWATCWSSPKFWASPSFSDVTRFHPARPPLN